jgi:CHASE3 domain sensor protein
VDRVSHTEQILVAIDDIVEATTNAETGQRGYLLTGQADYIKPFKRAEQDAPNKIAVLRPLLSDNPAQLPHVDRLQKLVEEKLDELKQTVELSDRGKTDEALATVRSNRGLRAMEDIAQVSQAMTDAESKRLQERLAACA